MAFSNLWLALQCISENHINNNNNSNNGNIDNNNNNNAHNANHKFENAMSCYDLCTG